MTTDIFNRPFSPLDAHTVLIDVAVGTANVALVFTGSRGGQMINVRIFNDGTATAWIAFGGASVVAALTDIPIGPGMSEVFTLPINEATNLRVAAIALASTGKIYFTTGYGI